MFGRPLILRSASTARLRFPPTASNPRQGLISPEVDAPIVDTVGIRILIQDQARHSVSACLKKGDAGHGNRRWISGRVGSVRMRPASEGVRLELDARAVS